MKAEMMYSTTWYDMKLQYLQDPQTGAVSWILIPVDMEEDLIDAGSHMEPLVQVKLVGDRYPFGFSQGRTMRNSETTAGLTFQRQYTEKRENGEDEIVTVLQDGHGCTYYHCVRLGCPSAVEVRTEIENTSDKPMTLELLSSFTMGCLSPFREGEQTGELVLHRLLSTWSAEGRLVSEPLEELHLEPSWARASANTLRFGQVGSMPVRGFVPFAGVEDTVSHVTWAASLAAAGSWQMEVYRKDEKLCLSGGIADRELGHWMKTLLPGERFITPKACLSVTRGGVNLAAQRLTENMRRYLPRVESERELPLVFNEFCTTWGEPLESMIEKMAGILKGKGLKYFVIDAGWYSEIGGDWQTDLGEWNCAATRFPRGIKYAADEIRRNGMIPGIWFELEVSGEGSRSFEKTDWMLKRDGLPITSGVRRFWDLRNPEVRDYLREKVIRFLKENGFGYLKVDYNETIGIGCEGAESLGEGLRCQLEAVLDFFDEMRREIPELVLEVCSSGGHRLTAPFLERASMASFSDAHECLEIPVIAANMHRMILPMQSQIWAVLKADQPAEKFYYQIVSGMLGRLCISGDIEKLQPEQWGIVEKGLRFCRRMWKITEQGTTWYYGPRIKSYRKLEGWQGIFRLGKEDEAVLLLHSFQNSSDQVEIKLPAMDGVNPGDGWRIEDSYHQDGISAAIWENAVKITGIKPFDGAAFLLKKEKSVPN